MEPKKILDEARKLIQQQGYDADMMIVIPGVFGKFETHLFKGGPVGKVASETEKGSVVAFKASHVVAALFLLTPRAADLPTECPHGHGDLIIDHDHVYCDYCTFSASR